MLVALGKPDPIGPRDPCSRVPILVGGKIRVRSLSPLAPRPSVRQTRNERWQETLPAGPRDENRWPSARLEMYGLHYLRMERCSVVATSKKWRNGRRRAEICALCACAWSLTPGSLARAADDVSVAEVQPAVRRNRASVVVIGDSRAAVNLAELLLPRLMDTSLELRFERMSQLSQVQLLELMGEPNACFIAVLDALATRPLAADHHRSQKFTRNRPKLGRGIR